MPGSRASRTPGSGGGVRNPASPTVSRLRWRTPGQSVPARRLSSPGPDPVCRSGRRRACPPGAAPRRGRTRSRVRHPAGPAAAGAGSTRAGCVPGGTAIVAHPQLARHEARPTLDDDPGTGLEPDLGVGHRPELRGVDERRPDRGAVGAVGVERDHDVAVGECAWRPVKAIRSTITSSTLAAEVTGWWSPGRMFGVPPSQQSPARGSTFGAVVDLETESSSASPRAGPVAVPMTLPRRTTSTVSSSPSA